MNRCRIRRNAGCSRQRGLSYIEVVVAIGLIVVALVPAMNALQAAANGSGVHQTEAVNTRQLRSKLEEVLAKPFGYLYAQTYLGGGNDPALSNAALSDASGADPRLVTLYRYDGNAATAADTGLLRIGVGFASGGAKLETLRGRWW